MNITLHICCAVCAAGAAERLIEEGHSIHGFFFNPNIHPATEYQRRLENARIVARELNFPLFEAAYEPEKWMQETENLAGEPEGGARCNLCFQIRLEATYRFMKENGYNAFTSTLTMGSNKPAKIIDRIGLEIGGSYYLPRDFKKREGFKRATELARRWELYRQNYCGCTYSIRDK
jgi:predicted adenine nucleotide alpha hydrolase (AANH) superfamily ATPase